VALALSGHPRRRRSLLGTVCGNEYLARRVCVPLPGAVAARDEDGAVGVPEHARGDAAHQGPTYPAASVASEDNQPHLQLLGEFDDLFGRVPHPEVAFGYRAPGLPDAIRGLLPCSLGFGPEPCLILLVAQVVVGVQVGLFVRDVGDVQF